MAQPTPAEEELKQKILRVLRESPPLKALDIARKIRSDRKPVNRVLHNFMRTEAEIKNPGQNPPLWGLVSQSPANSSVPSRASSSPGTSSYSSPLSSASRGYGGSSAGGELFSKSESVDGRITFTPVSGQATSPKVSPQMRSASGASLPLEMPNENLPVGVAETSCDSTVKLQPNNNTSVGAVNDPLPSKKKKKKKPQLAASFRGAEENSLQAPEENSHPMSQSLHHHVTQETESAAHTHIGQEGEPPDNEHVTQEQMSEALSSLSVDPVNFDQPVPVEDDSD